MLENHHFRFFNIILKTVSSGITLTNGDKHTQPRDRGAQQRHVVGVADVIGTDAGYVTADCGAAELLYQVINVQIKQKG